MRKNNTQELASAHFANEFAINGKADFTNASEWLIFIYSISLLDSMNDTELPAKSMIPVSNLKLVLKDNKGRSGDFYRQLRNTTKKMSKAVFEFETDVVLGGIKMPKYIPIFGEIGVEKGDDGLMYLGLEYNNKLKPLVIGLKENFVGIRPPTQITSSHAINFLIYAKAERDKRRKHDGKTTVIKFELEALKRRLNILGKYNQWRDFKKRVILPIQSEINKSGMITIPHIEYEKSGRNVTHVLFFIEDVHSISSLKASKNNEPTPAELERLTYAQSKAVKFLTEKGIYEGIAIRKIIPEMPSDVCNGYEDYFCEEIYKIVVEKSKAQDIPGRAAVMVDWFKKGIFKHDHFSRIVENVHSRKKKLNNIQRSNREAAKTMTAGDFRKWAKSQGKE